MFLWVIRSKMGCKRKTEFVRTRRAIRAPGTTDACKSFFSEEVYLTLSPETDLSALFGLLERELSDLFSRECPCFSGVELPFQLDKD